MIARPGVRPTAEVVAEGLLREGAAVERVLLGTDDAAAIAAQFERFCADAVGVAAVGALRYATSVGVVCALELADGRRVVVKIHGPAHGAAYGVDYLSAVRRVQGALALSGFPAPRPLLGPVELAHGLATVDEYRPGGLADAHTPAIRGAMAVTLARLIRAARQFRSLPGLATDPRHGRPVPAGLWGPAHSPVFDVDGTRRGSEWIEEAAREVAGRVHEPAGDPVVGHFDWSVKNLGWRDDEVAAVYDWDALVVAAEPVVVGEAARGFTATWELPVEPAPSPDEAAAFVAVYERARGRSFEAAERRTAEAAALFAAAGIARLEHAHAPDVTRFPRGSFRDGLARYGMGWFRFGG